MNPLQQLSSTIYKRQENFTYRSTWQRLHLDPLLLLGLLSLMCVGLAVLYSAANEDNNTLIRQLIRIASASTLLFITAQIPPEKYKNWSPWLFVIGTLLLIAVLVMGKIGKGAQRWLDIGILRFQPSELLKIAVPLMVAWYLAEKPLPPRLKHTAIATLLIIVPTLLIAKQPDLGTAIMVMSAGCAVLLFAGLSWRLMGLVFALTTAAAPLLWHFMHDYQRQRVFTFLNPETDPLGSGYHIIQSKIAIGSGGLLGKGWLSGSQSHLQFLPENATDFIFAVSGEEMGFMGSLLIILLYLLITLRTLFMANMAQSNFSRLVISSLGLTFFISACVNIGMVCGVLPVVGLPLPFISYGGTSLITQMVSFGIIMSLHNHRKFLG